MKFFRSPEVENRQTDQFTRLIGPHVTALYQSAFRLSGSQSEAEDIVQDVLIKLYPKTPELQNVAELRPWLYRTLYHQFVDHYRKQARSPTSPQNLEQLSDGDILEGLPSSDTRPEILHEKDRQSAQVLAALAALSQEKRALIVLHLIDGFTLEELTSVLNLPLGTIKSRLHRIKAELKKRLNVEPFHADQRGMKKKVNQ